MKRKKCRQCGAYYKPKDAEIKIKLNHLDIEAIEDIFFCELTEEQHKKIRSRIQKVWKQICEQEELHFLAVSKDGDKEFIYDKDFNRIYLDKKETS